MQRYSFIVVWILSAILAVSVVAQQGTVTIPFQYRLRQIFMTPEVSPESRQEILDRANACLDSVRQGADFFTFAQKYSEEPGADRTGGDLGFFTHEQMVKPFSDVVFAMNPGEITGPVETQYGYHIIQLVAVDGDRRHARHILFALTPSAADTSKVIDSLTKAKVRIESGEPFEEVFQDYNTNDLLATTHGYLVWQEPDTMLPSFSEHIKGLNAGEVTDPFISIIGMHVVLVDSINYDRTHPLEGFPPGLPVNR